MKVHVLAMKIATCLLSRLDLKSLDILAKTPRLMSVQRHEINTNMHQLVNLLISLGVRVLGFWIKLRLMTETTTVHKL